MERQPKGNLEARYSETITTTTTASIASRAEQQQQKQQQPQNIRERNVPGKRSLQSCAQGRVLEQEQSVRDMRPSLQAGLKQRQLTIDIDSERCFARQPITPKYICNQLFIPSGDVNGMTQFMESMTADVQEELAVSKNQLGRQPDSAHLLREIQSNVQNDMAANSTTKTAQQQREVLRQTKQKQQTNDAKRYLEVLQRDIAPKLIIQRGQLSTKNNQETITTSIAEPQIMAESVVTPVFALADLVTSLPQTQNKDEVNRTFSMILQGDSHSQFAQSEQPSLVLDDDDNYRNSMLTSLKINLSNGNEECVVPDEPIVQNTMPMHVSNVQLRQSLKKVSIYTQIAAEARSETESLGDIVVQEDERNIYNTYYISSLLRAASDLNQKDNLSFLYREHFLQSFSALHYSKLQQACKAEEIEKKAVQLPNQQKVRKTLVFDLDETLIHCNESLAKTGDTIIDIYLKPGEIIKASINIRPHAQACLQEMSKLFEIVVFTASQGIYANAVLDYLDPEKKYVQHRLFRESCVHHNNMYIKDLRIFKTRKMKDLILVDNSCFSFCRNLSNGVPIIPYYDDKNDTELLQLMRFLRPLAQVEDVRDTIRQTFYYKQYKNFQNPSSLLKFIQQQYQKEDIE